MFTFHYVRLVSYFIYFYLIKQTSSLSYRLLIFKLIKFNEFVIGPPGISQVKYLPLRLSILQFGHSMSYVGVYSTDLIADLFEYNLKACSQRSLHFCLVLVYCQKIKIINFFYILYVMIYQSVEYANWHLRCCF